jgi:hypothetical protein
MSLEKRGIFLTLEIEEFAGFLNLMFEVVGFSRKIFE